ncbi:hypothetical protein [Isoptericola croceus]|uniref:hypothetical protein n=1 Tax=Isoptericola croceus TaxID=3031406 RepID=UPI0023F8FE8F|nr:hypothetical protein [Isoptericola croceus]
MTYDQAPEAPVTQEQAQATVQAFIDERAASGVQMADAFTDLELVDGVLAATWREESIGKEKSDILLELNPHENLAVWLGIPLSFDNEEGRQIRQHVHTVSVSGPFGVHSMSVRDLYERATGLRYDEP